jgi:signal transduction histidine kinase
MLRFQVRNARERQQVEHHAGPIEFGRGPKRNSVPRCMIQDAYVSKDHARIEEGPNGAIRVENLSQKQPILLPGGKSIIPGGQQEVTAPISLGLGDTFIDVEHTTPDDVERTSLATINRPLLAQGGSSSVCLLSLGDSPSPEQIAHWFEAIVAVQSSSPASPEFYDRAARVLVDLVGLDRGLVLLRQGDAWKVVARAFRDEGGQGREFSHTILRYVVEDRRTFYQTGVHANQSDSLHMIQSVVASPIFNTQEQVLGVLYGTRARFARTRDIGPLEAQMVQLLASSIGVGMARLEQDNQANRLRIGKEAAEEAARVKSQFLTNMSHELRTPLTAIIGFSEGLLEQVAEDGVASLGQDLDNIHKSLSNIHKAGRHLLAVINDLLDLSKMEAGKLTLSPKLFEVAAMAREVAVTVSPLVEGGRNQFRLNLADGLGQMYSDETRVRQVLLNLLSNACKFTEGGMIGLSARRQTVEGRDWMTFRISDTGVGMTPEQLAKLFEEFSQVHDPKTNPAGGTGLGLAISRRICRLMGGDVTVESAPGKGTKFTVQLPAVMDTPGAPPDGGQRSKGG